MKETHAHSGARMSYEALIFVTLVLIAVFLWNAWGLRYFYKLKRCGVCATGRVVHCDHSYDGTRATIRYCAGNGVWEIADFRGSERLQPRPRGAGSLFAEHAIAG